MDKGSNKSFDIGVIGKENRREPSKKRLEKVKSSSILKKSENDIEFYSENNLPFVEEAKNETIEKIEERKKPKNVVIKKSTDQKYLLSFNKN